MSLNFRRSSSFSALTSFALALFLSCFAASGVAQTGDAVPVASRLTKPIDEGQLVTLKGTVHRLATAANDRGAVDDGLALGRMQVMLKRSPAQETALQQLIQEMHQPGTASYHKWLTPAQFGEKFGPSDADIATLSSWLNAHGFAVTKVNPGKQTLEITGNAGAFEKAFHASIHKYQVNGQTHYANAADPSIPAALAPVFGGFASLNNFPYRSYEKVLGRASYDPSTHKAKPEWTVGNPTNGYQFLLAPGDFAVQYDLNPLYTAGTKGAGQTIGIINEANISIALVNQYRTLFGLPANPPNVVIDGNDPGIDGVNNEDGPNGASGEAYLDVELAGAVAPAATVDLIIAGDTALANGLGLAAEHAVYGDVAPVLSISFGSCEAGGGSAFWNLLWEQAAAQGQTVMVSSGDAGSAACDNDNTQEYALYGQQVNGIASTPWNVAVGGTDFYYSSYNGTNSAIIAQLEQYWGNFSSTASDTTPTTTLLKKVPEQPWNDSQFGLNLSNQYAAGYGSSIAGGGGGASNCATGVYGSSQSPCAGYPKPAWQTGTGVPADKVRDLPDVSLFAANGANYTYYPICAADGDCQPVTSGTVQITGVGGTSASSPAFAGIMALVTEQYGPQGQADFVLYPLAKQYPTAFNDVTAGTNSVPCKLTTGGCISAGTTYTASDGTSEGEIGNTTTKAVEYNAGTGYDLASGLGTIDASNLVSNWNKVTFTASSVTLNASQTTITHGTAVTISGAVTPGTATGLVSLETTSSEPLNAGETDFTVGANGAYTGSVNFLPGGTYEIYGIYSGDGTYASSTSSKTSVTVTPEASTTTLEALNSTSQASNGAVTPAFASGATISYGTQVLLEALPSGTVSQGNSTTPTGSVNFLSGTTSIGTTTLNVGGEAELNFAPPVSATPYSITAAYSGDASYNASTSSPFTFTVAKNTPSLTILSGTQTSATLTAVSGATTLTVALENTANATAQNGTGSAYVSPALAPTGVVTVTGLPGGTLTFPALAAGTDPSTLFVEGIATVALPAETAGTYNITVSYPGDSNYAAVSDKTTIQITAQSGTASTTTVTASPTSTSTTSLVTFNVTVTGASGKGAPTGTVELQFGGYYQGPYQLAPSSGLTSTVSVALNSGGLLVGPNTITAQYSGDTTYAPSAGTVVVTNGSTATYTLSNSGPIAVTQGNSGSSTVTVTPANFTGTVTLSCAVTPAAAVSTPTCSLGNASASVSGTTSAATMLTVNTTATTSLGNYVVTVTGTSGSQVYTTSVQVVVSAPAVTPTPAIALTNGGPITLAAGGATGTSTITVTPAGGFTGAVTLSCAVTGTGATAPTCSVTTPVTIAGTAAGMATLTVTSTASTTAGGYTVTVTGSGTGITMQTTTVAVTVNAATSTPAIALTNSGSVTLAAGGATGTSTITVTPAGGFTGAVALSCAVTGTGATAPTCSVASPVTISGTTAGTATLTVTSTSSTTAGSYTVTVTGTGTGVTTQTTTVAVTVQAATTTPTVTLSDSGSITIATPGGTGTSTVTVTPGGGFTGAVALACSVGSSVAEAPTCTITSPVTITGTTAGTATLSIGTTAASAAMEMPRMRMLPIGGGIAAAALLFFLVPMKRKRISTLLGALVLIAVVGFSSGCGSGGTSPTHNAGTPAGPYTVTVSGTATGVTIAPITVSVTVQ